MFTKNITQIAPVFLHLHQRLSSYSCQQWQHSSSLSHFA